MFTNEDNQLFDRILEERFTCRRFSDRVPSKEDVFDLLKLNEFFLKKNFFDAHGLEFPISRASLLEKLM